MNLRHRIVSGFGLLAVLAIQAASLDAGVAAKDSPPEPSPPPCVWIEPGKLIVHQDGDKALAEELKLHGEWSQSEGIIRGKQGGEKHLATLRFKEVFEDCVMTFRIRFFDPGRFVFVAGGHELDFSFGVLTKPSLIKVRGQRITTDSTKKAELATAEAVCPLGEWMDVLVEHTGDQVRVRVGQTELRLHANFRPKGEKKVFYINAGDTPGTRVEFDDIMLWTGTPLK